MTRVLRARHAAWAPIMEAVVETIGSATPLYHAAIRARLGHDPGGVKFSTIAARLPTEDQDKLCGCIERLDTERAAAGRAA